MGLWAIHVEEMTDRGQRATPEVHQRGGEAQPLNNLSNRCVETLQEGRGRPFKGARSQHVGPIARGTNVQSVCKAMC